LSETKLYLLLGYSSVFQYAAKHFDYERSATYEALRVAKVLGELPRTLEAFDHGDLSYSSVLEITRVASAESKEEWLSFSNASTFAELKAEVKDAPEKKREEAKASPKRQVRPPRRQSEDHAGAYANGACLGREGDRKDHGGALAKPRRK